MFISTGGLNEHRTSPHSAQNTPLHSRPASPNPQPLNSFPNSQDTFDTGVMKQDDKNTSRAIKEESGITSEYSADKKYFRCNLCDELFENEEDRAQHSLIHVNRSNSLDCHICGKQFKHRTNLSTHLIVHSGKKPHQCHICHRRFTQKVNLQRHMHIHDGSKPFICRMCSKSFTQKANLQRHILSHTERPKVGLLLALLEIYMFSMLPFPFSIGLTVMKSYVCLPYLYLSVCPILLIRGFIWNCRVGLCSQEKLKLSLPGLPRTH